MGVLIEIPNTQRLPLNEDHFPFAEFTGASAVIGMYRFFGGAARKKKSMRDLTGNGNDLVEVGTPVFNALGVRVNHSNGFRIPGIKAQAGITLLAIARSDDLDTVTSIGVIAGKLVPTGTRYGDALCLQQTATSIENRFYHQGKDAGGATVAAYTSNAMKTRPLAERANYTMLGATLDPVAQTRTMYDINVTNETVTLPASHPMAFNASPWAADGISGRNLLKGDGTLWEYGIGLNDITSYTLWSNVLEVILIDSTMTGHTAQVLEQVKLSKAFWQPKGATIV